MKKTIPSSPLGLISALTCSLLLNACTVPSKSVATSAQSTQDNPHMANINSDNLSDPRTVYVGKQRDKAVVLREDGRGDRVTGAPWAGRSAVVAQNGMAATSHPLASQVAIDILKKGGNAVDAAIAANAAIGLMEPTGNGIGGDLFAIVWDPKTEKLYGLNGSGRSPQGQTLAQLQAKIGDVSEIPNWGSAPVTVPGTVDAWFELHDKFGTLQMAANLKPAIDYANNGFPVTEVVAHYMAIYQQRYQRLFAEGEIEEINNYKNTFLINGESPVEGQIFKNPDLANTLSLIARGGRDAFYQGAIADTIDAYFKRIGGALRKQDFVDHTSTWIEPVAVNYRGYEVWELPPNGQGIAALQMLNILEGYDLKSMGHNSADYLHVMTEAKKLAFEDRARFYADPDFYRVDLDFLLSKQYAEQRRKLIDMTRAATQVEHGDPKLIDGDTIYLTVADKDGMMVSLIQSNYRGMGSGLVADGLGFIFQNRGAQYSLDENHPNAYAPAKRPFHTIIPAFLTKDGQPLMSFGLMGGAMQPQGHVQMVVNIVDFDMGVQQAGDAARFHHRGSTEPTWQGRMQDGGLLELESGVTAEAVRQLQQRGHHVDITSGPFGGYQAIWRDPVNGVYFGASEMRKDGMAIGY
ncbi:gamma-glutamyltransferase [Thalassotalea ponticola]|uniref:gamma-glutamyltransferase n=1 Tax=Thalassotalea ponticola TaxID=1523392 RepID=UPI0025B5C475|nr:gamma-glutamyltransferase [Thalassotalea ponticola]MDN3653341.1 gamma-glutamyltransferase [Thalassotalea ponticola]